MLVAGVFGSDVALGDAGIVDEDVDPAVIAQHDGGGGIHIGGFRHVERQPVRVDAKLLQLLHARRDAFRQKLRDNHPGAGLPERLRAGRANPLAAAGNDGNPSIQFQLFQIHSHAFQLIQLPPSTL